MKSLVLYYSHSGNIARIARKMYQALQAKGSADLKELRHSDSKRYEIRHLLARFFPALTELSEDLPDISQYDLICLGSPVWAGKPAPLALKFLSYLRDIQGKGIVYFQVYGIEESGDRAIKYVEKILKARKPASIRTLNIAFKEAHDEQKIDLMIKNLVEQVV